MAAADERKQRSNRLQARVPSWSDRGALSHGVKRRAHVPFLERLEHARRSPSEPPVPLH
jgi:hypothetical protein